MIFPKRQAEFKSKIFRSVGFTNIKKCGILCERKGRLTTSSRDLFPVAFLRDAKFFPKAFFLSLDSDDSTQIAHKNSVAEKTQRKLIFSRGFS